MSDFEGVDIVIGRGPLETKTYRAAMNQQLPCNLIERACIENLKRSWTKADCEITYDIDQHASPPLGRCNLTWGRIMGGTRKDTFVVVEEIKNTSCSVMLGPAVDLHPPAPSFTIGNNVYTFVLSRQTNGNLSSSFADEHHLTAAL